jgi:type VI secretion system secreted protein Hcp
MAADVFLKLGDIKGESQDKTHKDEIEILSWSWGASNPTNIAYGSGGGTGKVSFSDISFMHELDKSSTALYQACSKGTHIPEATLVARKAGGSQLEYLVVKLKTVFVSSVQLSQGGSDKPTESVSLSFGEMTMEYSPQKADGTLDAALTFNYSVIQNVSA